MSSLHDMTEALASTKLEDQRPAADSQEGDSEGQEIKEEDDVPEGDYEADQEDEYGEESDEDWEEEESLQAKPLSRLEKYGLRTDGGKHYLMLSEWMQSPAPSIDNMAADWFMVPVPEGKRQLIVAGWGRTSRYTRRGFYLGDIICPLAQTPRKLTVLDCIFVPSQGTGGTLYILDVIVVNGHILYDCDTQMRFEWGKQQLAEVEGLQEPARKMYFAGNVPMFTEEAKNPVFKTLQHYPADQHTIKQVLSDETQFCFYSKNLDENVALDGVLFYHKDKQYAPGSTGLVSWLKGFMVPEMLGIPVGDNIEAQKPKGYAGMQSQTGIELYQEQHQERKEKRQEKIKAKELELRAMEAELSAKEAELSAKEAELDAELLSNPHYQGMIFEVPRDLDKLRNLLTDGQGIENAGTDENELRPANTPEVAWPHLAREDLDIYVNNLVSSEEPLAEPFLTENAGTPGFAGHMQMPMTPMNTPANTPANTPTMNSWLARLAWKPLDLNLVLEESLLDVNCNKSIQETDANTSQNREPGPFLPPTPDHRLDESLSPANAKTLDVNCNKTREPATFLPPSPDHLEEESFSPANAGTPMKVKNGVDLIAAP